MSDKLQKMEQQSVLPATASFTPFDVRELLEKAVDSKSAVEVIKELRAMQREDQERRAKFDFDAALSRFQADCPVIYKTIAVPDRAGKTAYKFAPIEQIEEVIRPLERASGFTHTFNQDVESQPGWVIARCTVSHVGGHSRDTVSKFPLGTKTLIMSDTQVYAAALTFANRRTLANAYGLVIAGDDRDGQDKTAKPAAPNAMEPERADKNLKALAADLWKILTPVRGTARNWVVANQWLWKNELLDGAKPEEAPNLTAERFEQVIAKAKELLK
jgi:hypothetical protein